jgi:hypothetical protein
VPPATEPIEPIEPAEPAEPPAPAEPPRGPAPNRVTPRGEIVAIAQRGTFMGNRGSIHRAPYEIGRPWQVRRWITCVLEHKGWVAPKWAPGRWTALFFWDEAVALAAGHRPCALCRRSDYERWRDAWAAAFGEREGADAMDRRLHADRIDDRVDGRRQRHHTRPWAALPGGTFVALPDDPSVAALVLDDHLRPWSAAGYGPPVPRPAERPGRGEATVLTPQATVEVLLHGYTPALHPSAGGR